MEMKCDEMKNDGRKEDEMNVINIEQGYRMFQSKCDKITKMESPLVLKDIFKVIFSFSF